MLKRKQFLPRRAKKPKRKRPGLFFRPKAEAIKVMPDGREICNMAIKAGRDIYTDRILAMHERQHGLCCNCLRPLNFWESTFEHENGRTAGNRDDRIRANGKRVNGASHKLCNQQRGSRKTPIWHGESELIPAPAGATGG